MEQLVLWVQGTALSHVMAESVWLWPLCEALHFVGLSMLVGAAGIFDLRLMGYLRSMSVAAALQMRGWAVAGIGINLITGVLFIIGAPDQYLYNAVWWAKVACLLIAGVNIVVFERRYAPLIASLPVDADTPRAFKIAGATSIASWFGVLYFGRMLPFIGGAF